MAIVSPKRMSYSTTCGRRSFLALLLVWGQLALMATAKPTTDEQHCDAPVTTASSTAVGSAGLIEFLQGRLPPTGGKYELRFENDAHDAEENPEDDDDEPETATYAMASSRNRMDHARIARCRAHDEKEKREGQEMLMDMSLPFPVFYINMDKSSDRRKRMERNFGKVWDLRRFPGVDGRNETLVKALVAPEDYEAILPYLVEKRIKVTKKENGTNKEEEEGEKSGGGKKVNPVLTSELGASLAHLTAIRQAYLEGHEAVMIAEDDLSPLLTPCWTSSIRDLAKDAEGTDWDLIQLGWLVVKNASIYQAVEWGPNKRLIKQQNQYGAASYLISRTGMETIMNLFFTDKTSTGLAKVFTEPDTWGNIVVETYLGKLPHLYVAMPSLFVVETFDTTIGNEEASDFRLQGWRLSNNHHITATLKLFDDIVGVPEGEEEDEEDQEEDNYGNEDGDGDDDVDKEGGSRKEEL